MKRDNKNAGLTLIEVIVSVALLAIVSVMLVTIMATAMNAVKSTRSRTNHAMSAAGQIETKKADSAVSGTAGNLSITFGTSSYSVSGAYVSGSDGGIKYYEFVPD